MSAAGGAFATRFRELDRWIAPKRKSLLAALHPDWSVVKVGEVAQQVVEKVKVEPDAEYKLIGVRWYGEGTFHRETVSGDGLSATYLTPVIPNAFIYNRLFAWKASFAVVPLEHMGHFVSGEFPQFIVNAQRVLPEYLYLFFTLDSTVAAVSAASVGSAAVSRNRFKEEEFVAFELPLPPLDTQRAIVARWQAAQTEAGAAEARVGEVEARIEADIIESLGLSLQSAIAGCKLIATRWSNLYHWSVRATQVASQIGGLAEGRYPVVRGTDCLCEVKHGCSLPPASTSTGLDILKISAVTRGVFDPTERKFAQDSLRVRTDFDLRQGDILMCRTNGTLGYVGMSAYVEQDMENLIFPDKVIRLRTQANILPAYLWRILQLPQLRIQIEAAARTAVGNYAIGSDDIWYLQIPLPPLDIQRAIVARVQAGRAEIARLRSEAETIRRAARAEVEALILGAAPAGAA